MYDLITQDRAGINWARNLPQCTKCVNNTKTKNLDRNHFLKCTLEEKIMSLSNVVARKDIQTWKKYKTKNKLKQLEPRAFKLRKNADCANGITAKSTVLQ